MTDSKPRISGRLARLFQTSQITPLLALVCFLLGVFAVLVTPREEEPQINVTMANVLIPFPGASVKQASAACRALNDTNPKPSPCGVRCQPLRGP